MLGLHRLWQDGQLAIVHGCGYDAFLACTSFAYWQTGAPHSGESIWLAGEDRRRHAPRACG